MCSRFLSTAAIVASLAAASSAATVGVLRVCADPNNLPFSNAREEGFENRIARLAAGALGARLEYTWHPQRRGFIRNTLNAGTCDAVIGITPNADTLDTTRPYYRSTHVFVTRARDNLTVRSMDDPRLTRLRIGVHVVGDDYASPPPLQALGRRGIVRNVSGYSIYGNYAEPDPPARLIEAVARRDVDVAIVWGPLGGYFAARQKVPLRVTEMASDADGPSLPFSYAISMGVRKGDQRLRESLQDVLDDNASDIQAILRAYRVPLKPLAAQRAGA
jgi:quinoprotein dehydrogenase-associated probable ABC transporter substrate-binding protein